MATAGWCRAPGDAPRAKGATWGRLRTARGDGINTRKETWPLTFVGRKSEIEDIMAFFDEHASYKAFRWRGKTFVAPQGYTWREGAFVWTLKVTIEQESRP